MRHRWRSAQGCHHRNESWCGGVRKPPAHRPNREMAPGTRPRHRDTQAQRSCRVFRSTVAVSKTGGLMGDSVVGAHTDLHSDQGARQGEHPGRSRNPIVKVHDIAWLEFEKPDLVRAEVFSRAFGFSTVVRTADELYLRGTDPGSPCVSIRRGPRSRFVAAAYTVQDQSDVLRLAQATRIKMGALPESLGGVAVDPVHPGGVTVRVVHGINQLEALPAQSPQQYNFGHELRRINTTQRPPREPTRVQRLGHVVLQTTKYREALNWYLDHLGMIVSDFLYYPGRRDRGPVMSFIRCDRGQAPADHHTLGLALGPANRYIHSA